MVKGPSINPDDSSPDLPQSPSSLISNCIRDVQHRGSIILTLPDHMASHSIIANRPANLGPCTFDSPLEEAFGPDDDSLRFVDDSILIRDDVEYREGEPRTEGHFFEKAGPRSKVFFEPSKTRAAIVTCGGLCPGLNAVIRSIVLELHFDYGITQTLGIRYGYRGLDRQHGPSPIVLTPEIVADIHHVGGSMLASSRGEQSVEAMVDTLQAWEIDILFCIGGDGTLRGAHAIAQEVQRRGLRKSIVGVPKTIDNDVLYCDRTFGFFTAVERAADAIRCAHVEAKGAYRGIGLVKLMGRDSGYIAAVGSLASQEANFVLVPEIDFTLEGERGLLAALERRLDAKPHAVIAVAEGAGQNLFASQIEGTDASGNRKYHDIGTYLRDAIKDHFNSIHKPVEVKYIDPSYLIRGAPPNIDDRLLCDQLARHAAHAAMSGRTDLVLCYRNAKFVHVPIAMAVESKQRINPQGPLWTAVLSATGQPARFG